MKKMHSWLCTVTVLVCVLETTTAGRHVEPRHCHGSAKHLHLAVGKDPTQEMTISFASKWSHPDVVAPIGGVHYGTKPHELDTFVGEQEYPIKYESSLLRGGGDYYSPYQHHITIGGLEPNTTYYFVAVIGEREKGIKALEEMPLRDHPSQHIENWVAENEILSGEEAMNEEEEDGERRLRRRKLAPPPYDPSGKPCMEAHKVRSFKTAPDTSEGPVSFAIIGDLGQFDHSRETLEHMAANREGIDAVMLVGDVAYTGFNHKQWDTYFDFLDDYSIFDEVPLQIATGNHDIDKQENRYEIFQAYESRFRMPRVKPPELGLYDGPLGLLNLDAPPYPLAYEWGNAYYSFDYGPAKHIVLSAYSSMEPDSPQYKWIEGVLKSVDRKFTPWVLVTIHVPIYNTFALHARDPQIFAARDYMEPLFVQYKVNIVFTGHIHAYQRTANVAMEVLDPSGPMHITIGAGGRACNAPFKSEIPEDWVMKRDASIYGYGRFDIFNQTHAEWKWIPLSSSDEHDYNVVKNEDVHLPQLKHDQLIVENQWFLSLE